MRANYRLRPPTREEDAAWLRKKLGRGAPTREPRPRPLRLIIAPIKFEPGALIAESEVAIYLHARHYCPKIGKVVAIARRRIVLAAWGMAELQSVALEDVLYFRLVGSHTWAERQRVAANQRRGGCSMEENDG